MNATDPKPTIVLVHGAFADASSWDGVIERLQQQGCTVIAPANPLRGVTADSAYIAGLLGQIEGPVLLGGHSYGGAVISAAATSAPNVVGLVFVAAFAPDEGETLGEIENGSKDSVLNSALVQYTYPAGPGGAIAVEFAINPAHIREAFAGDLPPETTALMAATVAVVIHNYRWRLGAVGEPQYDDLERRLAGFPAIAVPAITLEGDANGAPHADAYAYAYASKFTGKYEHRVIGGGVGHNLPQEAPQAFAQAIIDVDGCLNR